MNTLELKLTILGMMPPITNGEEFEVTLKNLYEWVTEDVEFKQKESAEINHLKPVN